MQAGGHSVTPEHNIRNQRNMKAQPQETICQITRITIYWYCTSNSEHH